MAVVRLPEQCNFNPRYTYSGTISISVLSYRNFCCLIRFPLGLKIITLVFFMLTFKFHFWQYLCGLLILFCKPCGLVDNIRRSSAYRRHDIFVFIRNGLSNIGPSKRLGRSERNKLNRVGLKEHPCLTPLFGDINFSRPFASFTLVLLLL